MKKAKKMKRFIRNIKKQLILSILAFIVIYILCFLLGIIENVLLIIPGPIQIIIFCLILYLALRKEVCNR